MSKVKIIPELRFPEFEKDGEWEINEFGELINILADFTANGSFASLKENVTYYSSEEYAVLVRTTDLDKKIFTPARFTDKRGYEFLSKTSLFGNEIVMANVGSIGKVFRVPNYDKPMTLAPNTYVLKFNDFVDEDFIYQLMLRAEFEKKLLSMVGSSTLMAINKSNLRSIKVSIPAKIEQQKIASCLSFLDEIIATHSQKLNLLKDHKKGLMQNLFPQEGEKVPKYRFKEFENDGEWVEKKLGDIIEIKGRIGYRGYTLEDIVGKGEGAISMSPSNINEFGTLSFTKSTYITWAKYEESPEIMLENGFTVLVKTGSTYGKVAFIKNLTEKTTINPQLVVLKNKKVNNYFLYLLVANESIQKQINATVVGGAIPTLSQESISNFENLVPKIKEQEKIAECLSSLNDLIISQTERIEQLKLHKKGLMQGLFPKIEI